MNVVGLEICVDTAAGLQAAVENRADRIELCAALSEDGLTPSKGMMELAVRTARPIRVMIRPRAGNFEYSAPELDVMHADIASAASCGVEGVVLGCNRISGDLDEAALEALVRHAKSFGLKVTLHRSFDLAADSPRALNLAIDLRIDTVLTSGRQTTALAGARRIAELVDATRARPGGAAIEIMAGGGVTPENIEPLFRQTGAHFIHASCSRTRDSQASGARETVPALIAGMKAVLDRIHNGARK
jgi:copper homeostasis protein